MPHKNFPALITAEELSVVLNIKESTIKKLAMINQLPCVIVNRRPRFSLEKILEHFAMLEGGVKWIS